MNRKPTRWHLAGVLLGLLILLAVWLLAPQMSGQPERPKTVTAKVDGADKDRKRDETVKAPRAAFDAAKRAHEREGHLNLDDETPKAATPRALEDVRAGNAYQREIVPPLPTAGASQGFKGCTTRFIRGSSSRNGVRPKAIVDHYTVSANRPGWADVWGTVTYFDRLNGDANSHFVIDRDGNCAYIVPIERKAHTQAAGNPQSVSIEVVNTGGERPFMATPGYQKLVSVHRQIGKRVGIPMRRGRVVNGNVVTSGIVQHKDGGYRWGGHTDIGPFSIDYIAKISAAGAGSRFDVLTKAERKPVSRTCTHRRQRDRQRRGSSRWREQNGHVADWRRTVKRNYTRLHSPWKLRNRGTRRKLQVAVYVNRRGACR